MTLTSLPATILQPDYVSAWRNPVDLSLLAASLTSGVGPRTVGDFSDPQSCEQSDARPPRAAQNRYRAPASYRASATGIRGGRRPGPRPRAGATRRRPRTR